MSEIEIFDHIARRRRRARVKISTQEDRWFTSYLAQELVDRWTEDGAKAGTFLLLGFDDAIISKAVAASGSKIVRADPGMFGSSFGQNVQCQEDYLPFRDAAFDGIFALATLDTVNDLPGALLILRKIMKQGGTFRGAFLGAGTLSTLKEIIREAPDGPLSLVRHHPQVDVRAVGDLLARAGFAQSVADTESIIAKYRSFDRLVADIRANGLGNVLTTRRALSVQELEAWKVAFERRKDEAGQVAEQFCPVYLTGTVSF